LGAFLGPAAVSFSIHQWNSGLPPLWMCVPGLLIACLLVFTLRLQPASKTYQPEAQQADPVRKSVYRSGMLWIIGLLVLVYVGTENGIGGWMTTYLERAFSTPAQSAALITGWFWLALTAGRLLSVFLGMKLTSSRLLWISLGGAATSGLIMGLATGSQSATILAVLSAGFSFGAIYPTMIAFTTSLYQAEPGKAVSVVAAMGSVGGALLPWLQGLAMGGLNVVAVPWFTAVETLLMLVVYIVIRTWVSRSAHSASLAHAEN
jgi:fucose permease